MHFEIPVTDSEGEDDHTEDYIYLIQNEETESDSNNSKVIIHQLKECPPMEGSVGYEEIDSNTMEVLKSVGLVRQSHFKHQQWFQRPHTGHQIMAVDRWLLWGPVWKSAVLIIGNMQSKFLLKRTLKIFQYKEAKPKKFFNLYFVHMLQLIPCILSAILSVSIKVTVLDFPESCHSINLCKVQCYSKINHTKL